ncbi:helix-turn-helix domain-containing protein [Streptococcus suis]|uniref:helix-turn-helix domain-containing protein n=1 Tax=Streptococcus suis TaxID=1307 RepID=UPI0038B7E340
MNKLKTLRKENNLTQEELAKKIGVNLRTLQKWENGESSIRTKNAKKLADHFGVSVGYLLGYSDYWDYIDQEITDFIVKETLIKFLDFLTLTDLMLNDEQIANILELLKSMDKANRSATSYETQVYGSEKALANFLLRYNYKPDNLLIQHIDSIYSQEKIENQFSLIEKLSSKDN